MYPTSMPPRWQTCATASPPAPSVPKNSIAPITATYGRMGIVTGKGKSQMRRSGKRMALAIKIPKIAPDAPIVGMSNGLWPHDMGITFTRISIRPAPTPQKKKNVDQQMPDAAVEKNVRERLPQPEARDRPEGHQAEEVVDPGGGLHAQEDVHQGLHQEDARAEDHQQLDAGRDEASPVEVVAARAERSRHMGSLRRWNARVKVAFCLVFPVSRRVFLSRFPALFEGSRLELLVFALPLSLVFCGRSGRGRRPAART